VARKAQKVLMFFHVVVAAEGEAGETCWERYASGPILVSECAIGEVYYGSAKAFAGYNSAIRA
jgi:hypothetical protein